MHLCDYGCGGCGNHQQATGKWSCDIDWRKCPGMAKKWQRNRVKKKCPHCNKYIHNCGFILHVAKCQELNNCLFCGKGLTRKDNKFCNKSCYIEYNNQENLKRSLDMEYTLKTCLFCKKRIGGHGKEFCSKKCYMESIYEKNISLWLSGKHAGCNRGSPQPFIRRWLIENRGGEKCERCGWAEKHPITGKIPIQIEHIDGNFMNNKPENLVLLCPNCHSLTPTYGSLNRGKGRRTRYTKVRIY